MSKLALLGGTPVRDAAIPWTNTMGEEEKAAVIKVMESGNLSAFLGRAGDAFLGGPKVREIEQDFAERFGAKHGISVNSATTALHTAIAACEIGPGDEVLVTPYTMAATATAILMNNAVPVFVDICSETYNLNPDEIEKWLTPRTKAILVTNLFGLPGNLPEIVRIARKHGLYVIEDNAQSPGATINGKQAGTFGDLGIFSLNYHKVIHSGEGGIILTDNEKLAYRCQLIRNHGEVAVDDLNDEDTVVLGSNYRMTELHAAIGIEQLKKLDGFLKTRRALADQLTVGLKNYSGLKGVTVPEGYEHSYYVYPIQFDKTVWGIKRATFAAAMKAEGFPLGEGYVKPLYLLKIFQHKKVYNQTQYPFSLIDNPVQNYQKGICPVVENMYEERLLIADVCRVPYREQDIDDFLAAVEKVWQSRKELHEYEKNSFSGS
ncbi:DegT/DnrJ/EryC1/StrS family aminotransferase [Sporomusa sp.]|uniref:DegT/DnrJ/EryC1/StrS family aminotransferase n=1 Tax=Sporomusa sp. TaxID=2078658 RepID=UPI002CF157E9|nr:DegT/DnrJ/EryC1/StrS family aminotransferase [Sporomusa sp.]HWR45776.1 DegT/DnrJ/EryC1/StrS family aminotransferase [Sporomusa sp.]